MTEAQEARLEEVLRVGVFRLQLFKPSETFITTQSQALQRYRPLYIGRRVFGPPPPGADMACVAPGWTAMLRLVLLRDAGPLVRAMGGRRVALLHAHFAVDAVYAQVLARRLGVPLVTTLHGFDVTRSRLSLLASLRPALVHAVFGWRRLVREGALFLGVSEVVVEAARQRGAPATRLRNHAVGVDIDALQPSGPGEPGLIVHVGRLVEKKGGDVLLEAFAELARLRPAARLVLIGEGPLRPQLQGRAEQLGVSDRVRFTGALPHVAALAWLRRAAVVAVPSRTARNGDAEGLPTVLLEAAALGRAIVASEVAGIAEAVQDEVSALLAPPDDPGRLATALARLLGDPGLAARLGAGARQRVETDYALASQCRELEACYDALVSQHRSAG